MKRSIFLTIILSFLISGLGNSQTWKMKRYEVEAGAGGSFYMGDIGSVTPSENIGGFKDVVFSSTRPVIHLGFRYKILERFWVKLNANYGWLYGDDSNYGSNQERGLVFSTPLFELTGQAEYAFIRDKSSDNYLMMRGKGIMSFSSNISFYGFAGFGPAFFWPKVIEDPNNRAASDFSNVAIVFPIGLGLKYGLTPDWKIGFEIGGRFTTTDYLDAFTSEWSKYNDNYFFATFHAIYNLDVSRKGWPTIRRRFGN